MIFAEGYFLIMKLLLRGILRFALFWILFFALCRVFFLFSVMAKWKGETSSAFYSFIAGMPMDLSAAAYIGAFPLLILLFAFLRGKIPAWQRLFRIYMVVCISLISLLTVIDINLYREWGSKVDYRAFSLMMASPDAALTSSLSSPIFFSLLALIFLIFTGVFISKKIIPAMNNINYPSFPVRLSVVLAIVGLFVLAGRGGISTSPLTVSSVYYSSNQTLNHSAINTGWNFVRDVIDQKESESTAFQNMSTQKAKQICDSLFQAKDSVVPVLKNNRPNIVLIILESFTADLIEDLNGEKGVTPFFSSLVDSGLLFTNLHSTGFRTDIGFTSIMTGYPSLATKSIINIPVKSQRLPALSSSLYKNGYHTSFYYGGETDFFNLRSFVLQKNFQRLVDVRDFEKNETTSKWGVFDHVVFNRLLADLKTEQEPFFSTILTLSNHEPFEVPGQRKFPGKDRPNQFRSTAYYTDECLKNFFEAAAKESWYSNTLFVLVADHGHRLPKEENEAWEPRRSHIPLLFAGNVLKDEYKGKTMNQFAAQVDIPASLLSQLGISSNEFVWSKNLFNPEVKHFAFYSFDNGFTWMDENGAVSFDNNGRKLIYTSGNNKNSQQMETAGKAFQQKVFEQFLSY